MRGIFLVLIGFSVLYAEDTFVDKRTNLEWQNNSDVKIIQHNWIDANAYCKKLKLSGTRDWRLPSIQELQTIVDITKFDPAIKSDMTNRVSKVYWSSSEVLGSNKAWYVNFMSGYTQGDRKTRAYYIRCVRGRQ